MLKEIKSGTIAGQSDYIENGRPLNNTPSSHSGLDPESIKYLITLDTGLRRYDEIAGFAGFCKGLLICR